MTISPLSSAHDAQPNLREMVGQKLMLDFRYFCETGNASKCRQPMTQLPPALQKLLQKYHIGGVILFAENVQDTEQIVNLTNTLQQISKTPIFISIDQEGGRVARINRAEATSFTGNMSIGATYDEHGDKYATGVATAIAKELSSLGINVNFAPTVDVNANPLNPVINVRSFGEDPKRVAKLGEAQVRAFEKQGVVSALKHFPGHGDTQVDSHTGLPKVTHSLAQIKQRDLLPFEHIIQAQQPGMIMTAHIQYPALDSSQVLNSQGERMIRPATMSRAIMHDLLRNKMGYNGVTITDALDMAGISDFFTPTDAVIETFNAGVDIALMPIPVRTSSDIEKFERFFDTILKAASDGRLQQQEVVASYQRIMSLKARIAEQQFTATTAIAKATLGNPQHRQLEAELALAAITKVKNNNLLPIKPKKGSHFHLVMPDRQKATALKQALQAATSAEIKVTITSLQAYKPERAQQFIKDADVVISAHASPQQSAAEIGGMDDVAELKSYELSKQEQPKALLRLMQYAHSLEKASIFISLRAPYEISKYVQYNQAVLASYAYNVDVALENDVRGPAYTALANVILGNAEARGHLPVSIELETLRK
ncbi:glycosyl hydrolase family 3 [Pseudoalteromonas luteoviolacea]|uniref:glycoside hydrolase family 3 protein n=1 Tax=Pseudoalteromonas luteoviolacea TaxID=43657 RepID=UPI001B361CF2|nr:glycoside hydrolase family 3 protein [Pseudoalteromonas luteoviolacea]MBQ4811595.1 glycosyl hydrolase family 3 [Pseudoalteromonas luteoviolacea]